MSNTTRRKLRCAILFALVPATLIYFGTSAWGDWRGESQDSVSAVRVAQDGYQDFLKNALAPRAKEKHGLDAGDGPQNASLGVPYLLHEIIPGKVEQCGNQACDSVLTPLVAVPVFPATLRFNPRNSRCAVASGFSTTLIMAS